MRKKWAEMLTYGGREMKTFQIINSGWCGCCLDDNILLTFQCLVMVIIHLVIGIPYSDIVRILRGLWHSVGQDKSWFYIPRISTGMVVGKGEPIKSRTLNRTNTQSTLQLLAKCLAVKLINCVVFQIESIRLIFNGWSHTEYRIRCNT